MNYKHGHAANTRGPNKHPCSPTYHCWYVMLSRAKDPEWHKSACFQGVPIPVCDRWLSFPNFLEDMGEKPPGTSKRETEQTTST